MCGTFLLPIFVEKFLDSRRLPVIEDVISKVSIVLPCFGSTIYSGNERKCPFGSVKTATWERWVELTKRTSVKPDLPDALPPDLIGDD